MGRCGRERGDIVGWRRIHSWREEERGGGMRGVEGVCVRGGERKKKRKGGERERVRGRERETKSGGRERESDSKGGARDRYRRGVERERE
jgi:hypothetical protein